MLITLLLGFILLAIVIAGMAIGVIMGRKPISGSCGGVGAALGEKNYTCDICGDDPNRCEITIEQNKETSQNKEQSLSYDVSTKNASSSNKDTT